MRKIISVLLTIAMVVMLSSTVVLAAEHEILSNKLLAMTESESLSFVKSRGIVIPDNLCDESEMASFVKKTITQVVNNPNIKFGYNYAEKANLADKIKTAVNDYIGIATYAMNARSLTYALQDSEVYGAWSNDFLNYNCYAYAIDVVNVGFINPGGITNESFYPELSILEMVNMVKDDVEALGYTCSWITSTRPTSSDLLSSQNAICFRRTISSDWEEFDYHFMKLSNNTWYHKPSDSQILKYNYLPTVSRDWTNERVYDGVAYEPNTIYDSDIYYIIYGSEHISSDNYSANGIYSHSVCCDCGDILRTEAHTWTEMTSYYKCSLCGYQSNFIPITPNALTNLMQAQLAAATISGENGYSIFIDGMEFYYKDGQYYYVAEYGSTAVPASIVDTTER